MSNRDVFRFLSHRGHWSEGVVIDRAGSLYATLQITSGLGSDLAGAKAIIAAHTQDNALLLGISDPRLEWWDHYCVLDRQPMPALPSIDNWFAARFDTGYRAACGTDTFCKQVLLLTLVWHPGDGLRRAARALWGPSSGHEVSDPDVAEFEMVVGRVLAGLSRRYDVRRLAVRDGGYSAIAEGWHVALNNRERAIPLTGDALGASVTQDRVVFGYRGGPISSGVFEIGGDGERTYGAILSFIRPPSGTRPPALDPLRALLIPITITNSARLTRRSAAVKALTDQQNRMDAARDPSIKQRKELENEAEKIEDGEAVTVQHQFSVAVFAPDIPTLDARVARVQSVLSDARITAIRETDALKAAFYAQLPGNARWRTRPKPIKSSNMLALAAKHSVPVGDQRSRWGAPLIYFRTTGGTAYPFHWHVKPTPQMPKADLGSTLFIGRSGAGKTALLGSLALCTLRVPRARVVICDRDLGLYPMVRAVGGSYVVPRPGVVSGWAPLRGLSDTPADLAFLWDFVNGLIVSDGRGPITGEEGEWLAAGLAREMRKPVSDRGLANVGAVLGQRDRDGAAARLRPWCRGQVRGWAFDGEVDEAHRVLQEQMAGFDTTKLLDDPFICGPALSYQLYLVDRVADGRPLLLVLDEVWAANQVEQFRERNNAWLKTGRKREMVLALATQSSADVLTSPIAHTLLQQIPRRIFLGEEAGEQAVSLRANLMGGFGLSEAQYKVVTQTLPNLPFSFLVQQPGGSYIGSNDLSAMPGMVAAISARTSTAELADRLIAERGSRPELWVPEFERLAPRVVDSPTMGQPA